MDIFALNTQQIDINCTSDDSCRDLNVCSKDGKVDIHCLGEDSCRYGKFCQDMSLNQTCTGLNSCKTKSPTMSPTMEPTLD